jgi:hypothetical protein
MAFLDLLSRIKLYISLVLSRMFGYVEQNLLGRWRKKFGFLNLFFMVASLTGFQILELSAVLC